MELKRVVVTGIGALTPIGNNTEDYWNGLPFLMLQNSKHVLPAK
jgi:3-oxoacyl-(acyl-carrier-protein) synthase